MADATVGIKQHDQPDRLIDNEALTAGADTVYRQRTRLGGAALAELAEVVAGDPGAGAYGLVVRLAGLGTVADDYTDGEVLADQTGAGGVLTFTFAAPVALAVVDAAGAEGDVARADPFGGTPSSNAGVPCRHETPAYLPVVTGEVAVWAPNGMVVSVVGYRRG